MLARCAMQMLTSIHYCTCTSQLEFPLFHVSINADFFKGKNVILFDDLLTSGKTIESFKKQLEAAGAYVEREIFVGRTIHHCPISNRGILQEMEEGFYEAVARSKRCFPQGVKINKFNHINNVA